jgi:hypothetical protein
VFNRVSETRRKESQGDNSPVREATVQILVPSGILGLQVPAQPRGGDQETHVPLQGATPCCLSMVHNNTGFTLHDAQALVGRTVRAKRAGAWQIEEGVVLEHDHTGTVIGVSGEYLAPDAPPRICIAVQIRRPAKRRPNKNIRPFVLRLDGKVVATIPLGGRDPLPFVLLLDKPTFATYLALTS